MSSLSHHEITMLLLSVGILLGCARLLGELAQSIHQPSVVGEILAGILLGPTVFGTLAPDLAAQLFPTQGHLPIVLSGLSTLAVVMFLLVAGMEVELSTIWRQGRAASIVSVTGIVFPFGAGLLAAWVAPDLLGRESNVKPLVFALFFATALAISALPVIAKTLMDLDLYRTDLGMVIIAAAICDDLTGWIVFAIVLGMMGNPDSMHAMPVGETIGLTLLFVVLMLTVGRALIHRVLPYVQSYTSWPGGVLGFAMTFALFSAAFTEWIGVHAIFGAFMFGVALGDSSHLREQTRSTIDRFVSFIFAPLFFASIGLRVNFVTHFDGLLVLVVLVIACFGKIVGCGLGALWGGMSRREAWAIGFGMNARGAMEIILGLLALQAGVIRERMFVALVVMALVTSIISGPMVQLILGRRKQRSITELLTAKTFATSLKGVTRGEVIRELVHLACQGTGIDLIKVESAVLEREATMHTGVGLGVAVPHARLPELKSPLVALGLSEVGVDFDSPDGEPVRAIFLILTPVNDDGAQLELISSIARAVHDRVAVDQILRAKSVTEVLAAFKSADSSSQPELSRD